MRVTAIGNPQPYQFFGTFAGLSFWPGGLSLLAAAPGVGKTSWLLRMVFEAARQGFPAALGCYEHTSEELKYRLHLQSEAAAAGARAPASPEQVEALLAQGGQAVPGALQLLVCRGIAGRRERGSLSGSGRVRPGCGTQPGGPLLFFRKQAHRADLSAELDPPPSKNHVFFPYRLFSQERQSIWRGYRAGAAFLPKGRI